MPKVTEVTVRFDNDTELVLDEIGDRVSPWDLASRLVAAIYRVLGGDADELEGEGVTYGSFKQ